jgi:hypothetical protein
MKYRVAYDRSLGVWTIIHGKRIVGGCGQWANAVTVAVSMSQGPPRRTWLAMERMEAERARVGVFDRRAFDRRAAR